MITPTNEFLTVFKETAGALSVCESIAVMNIAALVPEGLYIELGTYKGKSAMSAAASLKKGDFILVDPVFGDLTMKLHIEFVFRNFSPNSVPVFVNDISMNEIPKHDNYAYVFVDSADHDELALEEVRELEDRVIPNGIVAFHDFDSQFRHVRMAYDYLVSTGKYQPIPIDWNEIINYVRENDLEEGNNSWHHQEMEFPNFVGAVKRLPV